MEHITLIENGNIFRVKNRIPLLMIALKLAQNPILLNNSPKLPVAAGKLEFLRDRTQVYYSQQTGVKAHCHWVVATKLLKLIKSGTSGVCICMAKYFRKWELLLNHNHVDSRQNFLWLQLVKSNEKSSGLREFVYHQV